MDRFTRPLGRAIEQCASRSHCEQRCAGHRPPDTALFALGGGMPFGVCRQPGGVGRREGFGDLGQDRRHLLHGGHGQGFAGSLVVASSDPRADAHKARSLGQRLAVKGHQHDDGPLTGGEPGQRISHGATTVQRHVGANLLSAAIRCSALLALPHVGAHQDRPHEGLGRVAGAFPTQPSLSQARVEEFLGADGVRDEEHSSPVQRCRAGVHEVGELSSLRRAGHSSSDATPGSRTG